METPIKRLQRISAMRRDRLSKAGAMVDKMKRVADAQAATSQEVKTPTE